MAVGSEVDSKATRHDVFTKAAEKGGGDREMDMYREQRDMAAESAKAVAAGAMEAGLELGKMAKQTVDGMVDAAESVRDSFTDDGGCHRGRTLDDRIEEESSVEFVEDLRRRAAGYDINDRRRR